MTDYATVVYPVAEFYQQTLTGSLTDGLNRPEPYELSEEDAHDVPILTSLSHSGATARVSHNLSAFIMPTWANQLFERFLLIPSRLDLGNILSNQTRTVEIANLYFEPHDWTAANTDVDGLTFNNLPLGSPAIPYQILSFGSFLMQVGISADGPATIDGDVLLTFDVGLYVIPVTGRRTVLWHFQPRPGILETLSWKTDILEAYDGSEQRISLLDAPRSIIRQTHIKFDAIERRIRTLLVDWLARPFALPFWFEARRSTSSATAGTFTVPVPTDSGSFQVGGLAFIYTDDETYDVAEIDTINANELILSSELTHNYEAGTLVMPAAVAFAQTMPSTARVPGGGTDVVIQFTVVNNYNFANATGSTLYDGKVLLDDCNLLTSGENDSWERPVIVLDNESGKLLQTSRTDRSRFRTLKQWDSDNRAETWRVRRLLHAFMGSRVSFFLPSFRADMIMTQTIGISGTTLRVAEHGYSSFVQARRPFADVRMLLTDGTVIVREIIGAEADGDEDVLTADTAWSVTRDIFVADIERLEIVNLVRIADDQATFDHRRIEDAKITINVISVKE